MSRWHQYQRGNLDQKFAGHSYFITEKTVLNFQGEMQRNEKIVCYQNLPSRSIEQSTCFHDFLKTKEVSVLRTEHSFFWRFRITYDPVTCCFFKRVSVYCISLLQSQKIFFPPRIFTPKPAYAHWKTLKKNSTTALI